jgi:sigma-B regulation protein RsbU (phosphoserine phosphatase)
MPTSSYRLLRRRASTYLPTTKVGRLAMYFAILRAIVGAAELVALLFNWPAVFSSVSGWGTAFNWILGALLLVLGIRWARDKFMWRLRNRLIVTYVFIGVIPVLLLTLLVGIAGYLFLNQYATSQALQELDSEARTLEMVGATIATDIAKRTPQSKTGLDPMHDLRYVESRYPGLEVTAWINGKPVLLNRAGQAADVTNTERIPEWITEDFKGRVMDDGHMFLRAVSHAEAGGQKVRVLVSAPISLEVMQRAAAGLGELRLYSSTRVENSREKRSGLRVTRAQKPGLNAGTTTSKDNKTETNVDYNINRTPVVTAGAAPEDTRWYNRLSRFGTLSPFREWQKGEEWFASLVVTTRPATLIDRLFSNMGDLAGAVLGFMIGIGIFFAFI